MFFLIYQEAFPVFIHRGFQILLDNKKGSSSQTGGAAFQTVLFYTDSNNHYTQRQAFSNQAFSCSVKWGSSVLNTIA